MNIQLLIDGALVTLGLACWLLNREAEVTHEEVPIPIPVDNRRP